MQVYVESVLTLHHKGCLHPALPYWGLRRVLRHCALHQSTNFTKLAGNGFILLRIIVARYPPCGVVACHSKLCVFLFYGKIGKILLCRKFVTEAESVVKHTETYLYFTFILWLRQRNTQFIIMVANATFLAPHWLPRFIKSSCSMVRFNKACHEIGLLRQFRSIGTCLKFKVLCLVGVFLFEFQPKVRGLNNIPPFIFQVICRTTLCVEREIHFEISVRRL